MNTFEKRAGGEGEGDAVREVVSGKEKGVGEVNTNLRFELHRQAAVQWREGICNAACDCEGSTPLSHSSAMAQGQQTARDSL